MNTYTLPECRLSLGPSPGHLAAPITAVLPSSATDTPNWSSLPKSDAISLAVSSSLPLSSSPSQLAQPLLVVGLTNRYAAPASSLPSSSCPSAPTAMMSPSTATEIPNLSPWPRAGAVSLAVCVALTQPVSGLVNTYAAPEASTVLAFWSGLSCSYAPATTVSPSTATDRANQSSAAPSEAVSLAVCVALTQPPTGLTNTYAAPTSATTLPLMVRSSPYAPTSAVSPSSETA